MKFFVLLGGLSLGVLGSFACGGGGEESDSSGGGSCVLGQQVACACPGGESGVQVCIDGSAFGPCMCGDATGGQTGGESEGDTEVESDSAEGTTGGGMCGNGMEDPGECMMGDPAYCPGDCESLDGGTMDDTGTTGSDSCADMPIYVTSVPAIGSRWESGALVGFAAGQDLCRLAAMGVGAPDPAEVSVCDYEQVVQAEMAGEFAAIPGGTTAWIHRTTPADIMGVPSTAGTGGRCVDWTYTTNHISDGEHADFPGGGAVNYFLDNDTFYDGVDTTHTQPGMLECGTQMRTILCCNPPCDPEG